MLKVDSNLVGNTTVTTTIRKDGHVFLVHLIDPKNPDETAELQELTSSVKKPEEVTEKAEIESPEKDAGETFASSFLSKALVPFLLIL